MFFKKNKIIAIVLLVVIIVFAYLGHMNLIKDGIILEGMDNNEEEEEDTQDDVVPTCTGTGPLAPGCYNNVLSDDVYNYNPYPNNKYIKDDNYILKTQIVPPVCPACPSVINKHGHDGNPNEDDNTFTDDNLEEEMINDYSNNSSNEETNISNEETNISNQEYDSTQNTTTNITNNTTYNQQNQNNSRNGRDKGREGGSGGRGGGGLFGNIGGGGGRGGSSNNNSQKEIDRLKGEIKRLKQSRDGGTSDHCPPCPTPARCPEQSFTCQKVINYRSPNVGNLLPMPVLYDFSSFKDN